VAKKEVFEMPVLGWLARKIKAIAVSRDGSDVRGLLDCFKCLKNGEKICIFPEGTRNKTKEAMLPFKHGAAVMAIKCKAPIVPIVIYKKPRFFCMAHVLIGEPIELTEYYGKKLSEEELGLIDEQLRQRMLDMKQEHAAFLANKKKKA
jgi:1-acyl-sn-glycerol-3-phosphate acyltransferase